MYATLQIGTTLILILAANTSFTGFPFLASFAADDSYLPRQLTKRGHRLVFSTGIIVLTFVSVVLLLITRARVDSLIPLYALGVFTGFTMAGAGMAKYHLTHREDHWRRRLAINGTASVLSFVVLVIIAVAKFSEGAWVILIILPLGVVILFDRTASTRTRSTNSKRVQPKQRRRGSSIGTSSWSWSTAWTWRRPGPFRTHGLSIPTSCVRCTSRWTAGCRRSSWPSGAGLVSRDCH